MATIREIAERSGVSIGTVDRIIHQRGRFSEQTAERVRRVIAEADYRPNPIARQLSRSALLRVAVLMPYPEQDSNYWALPLSGIRRAERDLADFGVSVTTHHFDRYLNGSFSAAAASLLSSAPDACILAPLVERESRAFLARLADSMPLVFFDTDLPQARRTGFIGQDSAQSGRLAARLLQMLTGGAGRCIVVAPDAENHHLASRICGFSERFDHPPQIVRVSVESDQVVGALHASLQRSITSEVSGIFVADASVHYVAHYLCKAAPFMATASASASATASAAERGPRPALVGCDLVPENRRWLERGLIDFILTQRPAEQGYRAVNRLFRAHVLSEQMPEHEYTPIDIVTQENLAYVAEEEDL